MTTITQKTDGAAPTTEGRLPKITFRVTREFRKQLKMFAAARETSVEDLCKHAVTKHMEAFEGGKSRARV